MSSPDLKHRRLEDTETLVPVFHLPVLPPADGFPSEEDLLKPSTRQLLGDAKDFLLNASPTLELLRDEVATIVTALRDHPKCAAVREQLSAIDEARLETVFGEEDAREEDVRRRVDYAAGIATLKANTTLRMSMCVSSLTRGQHRHYRAWVIRHMQTGIVPKVTEDYPDMSNVLDLVEREQTAYLHRFMEETIACEQCKVDAGANRRSGPDAPVASHRACWNHNYIAEPVEAYARRWWRHRIASRLVPLLDDAKQHPGAIAQKTTTAVCTVTAVVGTSGSDHAKPTAALTSRTREEAARLVAAIVMAREGNNRPRVLPTASAPPAIALLTRQLADRAPMLYPSTADTAEPRENKDRSADEKVEVEVEDSEKDSVPPLCPSVVPGVSFTLRVCKSALLELATGHLSAGGAAFRLPVRCAWNAAARCVDIRVGKPLPSQTESRRAISAAAMKRLIDADQRLPSNGRCSAAGQSTALVAFAKDLTFLSSANCTFDVSGQHPVFRIVKMEYNSKGYNTIPDDEKTMHYERFSKREVVRMWTLLQCHPTATLYVYRVNAYSSAVIGIEHFSAVTFASQVLNVWAHDREVSRTWSALREVLAGLSTAAVRRFYEGLDTEPTHGTRAVFVLATEKQSGDVFLHSVAQCYPQLEPYPGFNTNDHNDSDSGAFIEAPSRSVCRREYLPPCVWPFPERIPFTFGPKPRSGEIINRTNDTLYDSEYYAAHDVWRSESKYYSVSEDGILRERFVEEEVENNNNNNTQREKRARNYS